MAGRCKWFRLLVVVWSLAVWLWLRWVVVRWMCACGRSANAGDDGVLGTGWCAGWAVE